MEYVLVISSLLSPQKLHGPTAEGPNKVSRVLLPACPALSTHNRNLRSPPHQHGLGLGPTGALGAGDSGFRHNLQCVCGSIWRLETGLNRSGVFSSVRKREARRWSCLKGDGRVGSRGMPIPIHAFVFPVHAMNFRLALHPNERLLVLAMAYQPFSQTPSPTARLGTCGMENCSLMMPSSTADSAFGFLAGLQFLGYVPAEKQNHAFMGFPGRKKKAFFPAAVVVWWLLPSPPTGCPVRLQVASKRSAQGFCSHAVTGSPSPKSALSRVTLAAHPLGPRFSAPQ